MGKIFRYDKPAIRLFVFLSLLFLTAVHGNALSREYDLLQKGYESYLSYQPEKASEEFRTFLQEFPRSSAADAALFWLGKSLMQAKSTDEAGQVFAELKRQFPDSPFVAFVVTQPAIAEREENNNKIEPAPVPEAGVPDDSAGIKQPEPVNKTGDVIIAPEMITEAAALSEIPDQKQEAETTMQETAAIESQISEVQAPMKSETGDAQSAGDQGAMNIQEGLQTTPTDGSMAKQEEPVAREPEVKEPAQLQEDQATGEKAGRLNELPLETGQQAAPVGTGDVLPKEDAPVFGDTIRQDDEQVKTGELSPHGTSESNTMTHIPTVLNKVGIQGALWLTGDHAQDFIDEQILYNEAVKQNLSVDEDKLNELRERYSLGLEEVDYLKRFLLICTLIDRRVKEIPWEKAVEVLSVRYRDAGQRERPELAAELQALANKGVTFEDISTSYPDVVHFKTFTFQELPEWIQERIQRLKNNEIGVIWSEEGYMILKPNTPVYSYDPFEELSSEKREMITTHIRSWIIELKGANPR